MDADQRERLEQLLYGLHLWDDPGKRKVFLRGFLQGHEIWLDLKYSGSQREAADSLLDECTSKASRLLHGASPVCALLRALRGEYATNPDVCAGIDRLAAELCHRRPERPRETWRGEPYRGLAYFDRRHAPIFFGREAELQGLIDALITEQGRRFLILIGASGSGKSSPVRAGLWARLERGQVPELAGSEHWLITAMTPTDMDSPLASLRAATIGAGREHDGFEDLLGFDWDRAFTAIENGDATLAALAGRLLNHHPESRWLLILDQMEELFTAVDERRREAFIEQLIDATKPPARGQPPRLQVLGTLRADFFHHCVAHASLRHVIDRGGKFLLGPPDRLSLERMVSGPLTEVDLMEKDTHGNRVSARWTLDPRLAPKLASDAAERDGGLALMAFALQELYRHCKRRRHLDLDSYLGKDFGGLSGSIGRRADDTLNALGEDGASALKRVFASLIHVTEDEAPTRRRERLSAWDADPEARRLVDAFVAARLLVARGGDNEQPTVEVAHEALLREWPKLKDWIAERRDAFQLCDRVRTEARAWIADGPHDRRPWPEDYVDAMRTRLAGTELLDHLEQDAAVADFLTPETDWLLAELCREGTGHDRRRDIGQRLAELGDPRPGVGVIVGVPDILWRTIPSGEVEIKDHGRFPVETVQMAAYPVTHAQFRAFLGAEDGYNHKRWWKDLRHEDRTDAWRSGLDNHPVTNISWHDATAFCRWLSARLDFEVRLPDEWEWQWAAQSGRDGFVYPWGAEWRHGLCNTEESGIRRSTAVGMYPNGASAQGLFDIAGNVWEWCRNEYTKPRNIAAGGDGSRVVRGGSWLDDRVYARAAYRDYARPDSRLDGLGFRVVCASPMR